MSHTVNLIKPTGSISILYLFEWVLLIGLTIASGWFAYGVLDNFFSQKSSFSQSEEAVKTHPVIVIEFRDISEISLDDVKIYYK